MLILVTVQTVSMGKVMIAIDPWKVEQISPAPFEDNMCNLTLSAHNLRVESSLEDLVTKINNARKGDRT